MSEKTAVPISWEAVKALAMVVGVREAARRMGLSEDQVRQRSCREKWLASDTAKRAVQLAHESRMREKAVTTLSPAALIHAEIASLGSSTRLSLARGMAKAGKHVETLDGAALMEGSANVKNIAQTADLVHGWKDQSPQVKIRLDLSSGDGATPIIDVDASPILDVSDLSSDNWDDDY